MDLQKDNSQESALKRENLRDLKTSQSVNDLYPSAPPLKEDFHKHLDHLEFFQRKIIIILKRNELSTSLIEILSDFFVFKDETQNCQKLSLEMLEYHFTLTHEIYKMLHSKSRENIFSELLILFLRYDFNKSSVCSYYTKLIETLRAENNQLEKPFFEIADFIHTNFKIHFSYSKEDTSLSQTILKACTIPL